MLNAGVCRPNRTNGNAGGNEDSNDVGEYMEETRRSGQRGRCILDEKYSQVLVELLMDDPNVRPRKGVRMFMNHFDIKDLADLVDEWPTESQFKSKTSRLKAHASGGLQFLFSKNIQNFSL